MDRRGFTLVELLVVISIILLVSVVALPSVVTTLGERQVIGGAASLQAAIAGCRDLAARDGSPRGIRLELDPAFPPTRLASGRIDPASVLVANRWVPMKTAPDYTNGRAAIHPTWSYPAWIVPLPVLVLEEQPGHWEFVEATKKWIFVLNDPATWWGNLRVGERVQLNDAGPLYTICGPQMMPTPEGFLDATPPSGTDPFQRTYTAPDGVTMATASPQWLWLVNGQDDDGDGYIDNGWDGVDNDGLNGSDDPAEWETERWAAIHRTDSEGLAYAVRRRPVPADGSLAVALPSGAVIDLTTALSSRERSRVPVDPTTGTVTLMVQSDGRMTVDLPYGTPSAIGLGSAWKHFWITDRGAIHPPAASGTWNLLPDYGKERVMIVSINGQGHTSVEEPGRFDASGNLGARAPFLPIEQR